jgi:hypothetical protein
MRRSLVYRHILHRERRSVAWEDQDLIFTALATSGLSYEAFAAYIARVPVRTVKEWIDGAELIPAPSRFMLESFMALPPDTRRAYIVAATAAPDPVE